MESQVPAETLKLTIIKQFIKAGEYEEAISTFVDVFDSNEATELIGRFNRLKREMSEGTIVRESFNADVTKIIQEVLVYTDNFVEPDSITTVSSSISQLNNNNEDFNKIFESLFDSIDGEMQEKYPEGFIAPKRNKANEQFASERLFSSLVKLGVPISVSIKILRKATGLLHVIIGDLDLEEPRTSHIRHAVVQAIYSLSSEFGRDRVQVWGDKYARRYGNADRNIKIIYEDGNFSELTYPFLKTYLIPDVFSKILKIDYARFKSEVLSVDQVNVMAENIMGYLRSMDLYQVRYRILFDLVSEIGVQPPHPWFSPPEISGQIITYDLGRVSYHKLKLEALAGSDDLGSIHHHCKELIHHSCSAVLSYYDCYLGCFDLAPLRVLQNLIDHQPDTPTSAEESFFRFQQFLGDLYSTKGITKPEISSKLHLLDRDLSSHPQGNVQDLSQNIRTCFEIADILTSLVESELERLKFFKNISEELQSKEDLIKFARSLFDRVPGIRFSPKQDDEDSFLLWTYHDIDSVAFKNVSPKFAISIVSPKKLSNNELIKDVEQTIRLFDKKRGNNFNVKTLFLVYKGNFAEVERMKNYAVSSRANLYIFSVEDLRTIFESKRRLEELSNLLLDQ